MDARSKWLRPKTRQGDNELVQPASWQGQDSMANRVLNPVRTFETPLVFFPADIVIGASTVVNIPLPPRCCQIAFISLIPNVVASFNSGGGRTIKDGFVMNGEFTDLQVATDAGGSCIIQLGCY